MEESMHKIRLALDWSPNTNHTGFLVSKGKGYYKEANIDLEVLQHEENEKTCKSSIESLLNNEADVAICSIEELIHCRMTLQKPLKIKAIASLLAKNPTGLAIRTDSNIKRPRDLSGCTISCCGFPFEKELIQWMVMKDGGKESSLKFMEEGKNYWKQVLQKNAQAAWVYEYWQLLQFKEQLKGEGQDFDIQFFKLEDFGMNFYQSPLLITTETLLSTQVETLKQFLIKTCQGFLDAAKEPTSNVKYLDQYLSSTKMKNLYSLDFLQKSQVAASSYYLDNVGQWGRIQKDNFVNFMAFLGQEKILKKEDGSVCKMEMEDIQKMYLNLVEPLPISSLFQQGN